MNRQQKPTGMDATGPDSTGPGATQADTTGPGATEPDTTGPGATEPDTAATDVQIDRIKAVPVRYPGRWISATVLLIFAALTVSSLISNPTFAWPTVAEHLFNPVVLRGVGWTLILTVSSMAVAVMLAVGLAMMRESDNPVLRTVSWFYIWFFRGWPVYTQLIFWGLIVVLYPRITLGVPFGPQWFSIDSSVIFTASVSAIAGLALNEAAYLAEIVRAGLSSVDHGQNEAARALGMTNRQIMYRVVLPQAMRVIVPPTGNETISMLKTTSLVLAVPFTLDLQFATGAIGSRTFQPVPLLIVAAFWYLAITSVLMVGQYYLERYYGRGFDRNHTAGPQTAPKTATKTARQPAINAAHTTPEHLTMDDMGHPTEPRVDQ